MLLDLVHLRLVEPALGIGRQAVGRRVDGLDIRHRNGLRASGVRGAFDLIRPDNGVGGRPCLLSPTIRENARPAQILSRDVKN